MKNILNSASYVNKRSKHVKINNDKIKEMIKNSNFINSNHWLIDNPFDILTLNIKDLVQLLLIYHSVGFCYWKEPKWEVNIDNVKYDGAYAMLGILVNRYKKDTSRLTGEEFINLVNSNNEIPLLEERLNNLKMIEDNLYYDIKNIVKDTELFDYIINKYSYFKDESKYNDEGVYFYKLAQLLVSDILHIRKIKEKIEVDYSNLLGCADYKIPQVLNCYGILEYSKELETIINNKEEIKTGSIYEIEIRANTLVAINQIYQQTNKLLPRIEINDCIWLMGQDKTKINKFYHRTYTKLY